MSDCVMFVCFTFGSKIFACSQKYLVNFGVKVVASCYWRQALGRLRSLGRLQGMLRAGIRPPASRRRVISAGSLTPPYLHLAASATILSAGG